MEASSPRIRTLLRQANRVAEAGKRSAAEKLYRQIIEEAPDTAEAWTGLAGVTNDLSEREKAYEQALELDPENHDAQTGLATLQGREVDVDLENESSIEGNEVVDSYYPEKFIDSDNSRLGLPAQLEAESTLPTEIPSLAQKAIINEHKEHDLTYSAEALYCANHPNRQTHLRCNRCGKPICSSCAQPTPVGYRCPECIREHEDIFYTATTLDYLIAVMVAVPLSLLGGWLATLLGFLTIFLGAIAGGLIGRLVFRAAGRRRGRWMPQLVGVIVVIGGILPALPSLLFLFMGSFNLQLVWSAIYVASAAGAAYYQMK